MTVVGVNRSRREITSFQEKGKSYGPTESDRRIVAIPGLGFPVEKPKAKRMLN
ncbi:hypothetical protein [Sporosarcina sp. E16_8]|uniref:hypothetical protein n=1 Tax=Sporosarcina sp. E16_8 TaxID=2789295 RepID=UPI001A936B60|nr:hypothetical protein [Sporosarcina sp. E16_8]MBO0586829.1 hypothetical protein [Sporosarcina sp. E16_8]